MDSGSHKPNSMPNGFSRIEVITGVGRRRSWTPEQKARIVAESMSPTTTVSAVARHYSINTNQLFQWRRELGAGWSRRDAESEPTFVPLIADSRPIEDVNTAERLPVSTPAIEVVAGRLSIRVPSGVDEATLRQVLGVVREFA